MAKLKVTLTSGPHAGEEFVFDRACEFSFGRSPQTDCSLPGDPLVSRLHACLVADPAAGTLGIRDLGSTNGFRVNSIPVEKSTLRNGIVALADGDEVMIGKTRLRVSIMPPTPPEGGGATNCGAIGATTEATVDSPDAIRAGRRRSEFIDIPGYTMLRQLGSGSMGVVYKARKNDSGDIVAIKVMTNGVVADPMMLEMFEREIEITKSVRHPNIIRFWDSGSFDRVFYLVIEYVGGGDLADLIRKHHPGGVPPDLTLTLLKQAVDALSYAHSKFLVHRDLKPGNVLIDNSKPEPTAKIADLGLAKNFANSGLSGMTSSFTRGGTMAYMPPEQANDFRDVKPSADIFSLAATFYEALTGRTVYAFREGESPIQTISNCRITPIRELNPALPEPVAKVLHKALAKNPDDRYRNASFMLADMHDAGLFE